MRGRFVNRVVLAVLLICRYSVCLATETQYPNQSTQYLDAAQENFDVVRAKVGFPGSIKSGVVVGYATSMEKILPRFGIPPLQVKSRVELKLARNEKESFQVIILPRHKDIKQVWVCVSDLRSKDGNRFSAKNIQAVPMGYVKTKTVPPYGSTHVGWWPDPILDFMKKVDIAKSNAQSFWIRIHAPKDQAPKVYEGKLDVMIKELAVFSFDLSIRVYSFALPDASPLPLAVTFAPRDYPQPDTKRVQTKWRQSKDYPVNAWRKHKRKWADFLADYYLTYDNLYGTIDWTPDFEIIEHLHKRGRLGRFNLGYYWQCGESPEEIKEWRENVLNQVRPAYKKAKQLGVLDHAYIYGCDEAEPALFPQVQRAAEILKAEFPDLMVMTTAHDQG